MFLPGNEKIAQFKLDFFILKLCPIFELIKIQREPELLEGELEDLWNGFFIQGFFIQLDVKLVLFYHFGQNQYCE